MGKVLPPGETSKGPGALLPGTTSPGEDVPLLSAGLNLPPVMIFDTKALEKAGIRRKLKRHAGSMETLVGRKQLEGSLTRAERRENVEKISGMRGVQNSSMAEGLTKNNSQSRIRNKWYVPIEKRF